MKLYIKIQPLIDYCKSNQNKIVATALLLLLIPQLFFATYLSRQLDQGPYSIMFNSPKYSQEVWSGYAYTYDQDAMALQWFKENSDKNAQIFSDDYGTQKITSTINQRSTLYQKSLLDRDEEDVLKGYIFLTVINEYYTFFMGFRGKETKISSFNHILNQKNKIFTNGAVLYR